MIEGLHNNVQVERAVNEVLRSSTLQVRFQQEVSRLLRALVEVVDVTDQHLPLLPGRNDDSLLKADASKVWAGGGRCDDDPRTPSIGTSGLQGPLLRICGSHAQRKPTRREKSIPGHAFASVVAARSELSLKTEAAVVPRRVVDDPRRAPCWRQIVTRRKETAVYVEVLCELDGRGCVELEG